MARLAQVALRGAVLTLSRSPLLPEAVTRGLVASGTLGAPGTMPAVLLGAAGPAPVIAVPLHVFCRLVGCCVCAGVA